MKIAMLLLLWMAASASSPWNSSAVSGVAFPLLSPSATWVFCWEREMREAGLGVEEITHLRLALNPFSAADFPCLCKSRSTQGTRHL